MKQNKPYLAANLQNIIEIRHNKRFSIYSAELPNAKRCLLKVNNNPRLNIALENELWWHTTVKRLVGGGLNVPIKPLDVYGYGEGFIILQFIEGNLLVDEDADSKKRAAGLHNKVLAKILAAFDQIKVPFDSNNEDFTINSSPYNNLAKNIDRWLEPAIKFGQLKQEESQNLHGIINKNQQYVEPRLQHGDFTPWQIMREDLSGDLYLIDGEKSSFFRPRFYDLAYLYTRIITHTRSFEAGNNLLILFRNIISSTKEEEFKNAFLPVFTQRVCGIQFDAVNDYKKGDDYREIARRLTHMAIEGRYC